MRYLFDHWTVIASAIEKSKSILLLLDYDGTLTPIAPTPAAAVLDNRVKKTLASIARKDKYSIGIISGRSLSEVKRLVRIKGIYYAGNHGLEIEGEGVNFVHPDFLRFQPGIKEIHQMLRAITRGIKGVVLEDKGLTLSLHYRLVDKKWLPGLKRAFNELCLPYQKRDRVKLTSGKKVLEVRPAIAWGKGEALKKIKQLTQPTSGDLTLYIGDDKTDEGAFKVIKGRDISILVGKISRSSARYYLKDTKEVEEFLERIDESKEAV